MDYREMAAELLQELSNTPQVFAEKQMSKRLKGRQFVVAYVAMHGNAVHPRELSNAMMVSTARIATLLRELEQEGIVSRQMDPDDSRQVIVSLTEKGLQLAEEHNVRALDAVTKMLEYLGPEDAQSYLRIRKKLSGMNFTK